MKFSERLSTLMELFDINNTHLAHSLYVDASLISRWRNGSRQPKPQSRYYDELAEFFTKCATAEGKTANLRAVINYDNGDTKDAVLKWLMETDSAQPSEIAHIFSGFDENISDSIPGTLQPEDFIYELDAGKAHSGSEGKRQLVMALIGKMLREPRTYDIYFFSDQSADWFFESNLFYKRVITFLQQFTGQLHLTLIHTFQNAPETFFCEPIKCCRFFCMQTRNFIICRKAEAVRFEICC